MSGSPFEKARIIWEEAQKKNTWVVFRRSFNIGSLPESAFACIGAETKYWLYVNGIMVVHDGGLNRESVPGCGYYDRVDIAKHLHIGRNTVALLVWFWGNEGRNNTDSGKAGLIFSCEALGLYSDESFYVMRHPAYIETRPPYPAYLYGGYNIGFDASVDIGAFQLPEFDDSSFLPAFVKGSLPDENWGRLLLRPIPQFRFSRLKEYERVDFSGNVFTAVMAYAAHCSPYFKIRAEAGLRVDVRTDRYAVEEGPGRPGKKRNHKTYNSHRLEYVTCGGIQEYECPYWLFGEKMIYTFDEGIDVLDVKWRETGYDCDITADFKCDDEHVNRLVQKCARTLYVCMRENYMDCPDRERGQWIGDVSVQMAQTFYCLDRRADTLSRKAVCDIINLRKGDIIVANVPGRDFLEMPGQSLAATSDIGMIMTYYYFSGDESIVSLAYPALKNYLMLWEMGDDGLVKPRSYKHFWFDHRFNIDTAIIENCWYCMGMKAACAIARKLGFDDDCSFFANRMESIKNGFDTKYKRQYYYASDSIADDRANALAIVSGLADDSLTPAIMDIFDFIENGTPFFEYYVSEAMFGKGYGRQGLNRMLRRYLPLIVNENSTLWEDFSGGTKNHAWSGGPLTIMYKYVAGIFPSSPGFKTAFIKPVMTGLKKISCSVVVPGARIAVRIEAESSLYTLSVALPEGYCATVGIPWDCLESKSITKIMLNSASVEGIRDGGHILFELCGGNNVFTIC